MEEVIEIKMKIGNTDIVIIRPKNRDKEAIEKMLNEVCMTLLK